MICSWSQNFSRWSTVVSRKCCQLAFLCSCHARSKRPFQNCSNCTAHAKKPFISKLFLQGNCTQDVFWISKFLQEEHSCKTQMLPASFYCSCHSYGKQPFHKCSNCTAHAKKSLTSKLFLLVNSTQDVFWISKFLQTEHSCKPKMLPASFLMQLPC